MMTSDSTVRPLPRPEVRRNLRLTAALFSRPTIALDEIAERYHGACSLGFGPIRLAIVGDPAAIRDLHTTPADAFLWNHRFQRIGPATFTGRRSMLASDGADHTRRRGAVQAAFTRRRLNAWTSMIVQQADIAIDRMLASARPGVPIDVYPHGRTLILGITLKALFGDRWSERVDQVEALVLRAQSFLESPAIRQLPLPVPVGRRAQVLRDRRKLDLLIDEDLARARSRPEGSVDGLIGSLAFDTKLSDGEIRDQVVTLIGAGFDTTASTLAWAMARIGRMPSVRAAIRAEADQVDEPWSIERFEYTGRVVREVLRLHPAGVLGVRMAARDVHAGGHVIPKGTLVAWSPYLSGRDPATWPQPTVFDPDRYLDPGDAQRAAADLAWVPFGRGPHMCIGFALAQLELTLILARVAQRIDLAAPDIPLPSAYGMVINRPVGGAPVTASRRAA